MNPAPTPTVIEYVNGISSIVSAAGIATVRLPRSMRLIWDSISTPTTTSAGSAASLGTSDTSGVRNSATTNSSPVTTEASPVRAPSAMPDDDSTYVVAEEADPTPPTTAAAPSRN